MSTVRYGTGTVLSVTKKNMFVSSNTMMKKLTITFYFDVVSPYACLSFFVLKRYRKIWNLDLQLKPVFLGGIMKLADNRPPGMHPLRSKFLRKDFLRNKQYFNLPEMCNKVPDNFIPDVARKTLQVQRFLSYTFDNIALFDSKNTNTKDPEVLIQKKMALLQSFFEGVHFDKEERLKNNNCVIIDDAWITKKALDSGVIDEFFVQKALLASKNDVNVKEKILTNTQDAVNVGGFGLPIMLVGEKKEFYFGSDRFEQLACNFNLAWNGPDPTRSHL